jgi:hypothetical protein
MGLPTDPNYVLLREIEVALVYDRSSKSDVLGKYWRYRVHYELTFPNNNLPSEIGFVELQFEPNAGIYEELKVYKEVPSSAVLTITKVEGYNGNNGVWESFTTSGTPDFNNNDLDYVPNDIRLELRMGIEYYERLDAASIIPINDLEHNFIGTNNEKLQVVWKDQFGAEEYDLEYTFVDGEIDNTTLAQSRKWEKAVRVRLSETYYEFDLIV